MCQLFVEPNGGCLLEVGHGLFTLPQSPPCPVVPHHDDRWQWSLCLVPALCFSLERRYSFVLGLSKREGTNRKKNTQKVACFKENEAKPVFLGAINNFLPTFIHFAYLPGLYRHLSLLSLRQMWQSCHSPGLFCLTLALSPCKWRSSEPWALVTDLLGISFPRSMLETKDHFLSLALAQLFSPVFLYKHSEAGFTYGLWDPLFLWMPPSSCSELDS